MTAGGLPSVDIDSRCVRSLATSTGANAVAEGNRTVPPGRIGLSPQIDEGCALDDVRGLARFYSGQNAKRGLLMHGPAPWLA
jgi:hypothetical protein